MAGRREYTKSESHLKAQVTIGRRLGIAVPWSFSGEARNAVVIMQESGTLGLPLSWLPGFAGFPTASIFGLLKLEESDTYKIDYTRLAASGKSPVRRDSIIDV